MREFHGSVFWLMTILILISYVFGLLSYSWSEEVKRTHPEKTMIAVRVNPKPPKIDGVLDDKSWQHAPIVTDFIQSDPNEGVPATEKTTVQVTYDDEALYVGIICYDSEPDNCRGNPCGCPLFSGQGQALPLRAARQSLDQAREFLDKVKEVLEA